MATGKKHEWIIILPDKEGALDQRMKVRPAHLENLKPDTESGFWAFGGAMLDSPPVEGEKLSIRGSVMLGIAETRDEIVNKLKADVYFKEGVWDWDKVQIYPFKSAFRYAL